METGDTPAPSPEPLIRTIETTPDELYKALYYHTCLLPKDKITYTTKYNLDEDGIEDTVSIVITCSEDHNNVYTLFVNDTSIILDRLNTLELYFGDLNPSDNYFEILITAYYGYNNVDAFCTFYIYRYTGSELLCIHSHTSEMMQDNSNYPYLYPFIEQEPDDNLQTRTCLIDIPSLGFFNLCCSLEPYTAKLVHTPDNIYRVGYGFCLEPVNESSYDDYKHLYEFNRSVTLYTTPECTEYKATLGASDKAYITEIRIDPDTDEVTHVFVEYYSTVSEHITISGWLDLQEYLEDYYTNGNYIINEPLIKVPHESSAYSYYDNYVEPPKSPLNPTKLK